MRDFRKFEVWKKAHALTLDIYRVTAGFPDGERFGLTSQLRRAAASIGANLAEGSGRESDGDLGRFVAIAAGSACEVEYHILLAHDLGLLHRPKYEELDLRINEIKKMLASPGKRVRSDERASSLANR